MIVQNVNESTIMIWHEGQKSFRKRTKFVFFYFCFLYKQEFHFQEFQKLIVKLVVKIVLSTVSVLVL